MVSFKVFFSNQTSIQIPVSYYSMCQVNDQCAKVVIIKMKTNSPSLTGLVKSKSFGAHADSSAFKYEQIQFSNSRLNIYECHEVGWLSLFKAALEKS